MHTVTSEGERTEETEDAELLGAIAEWNDYIKGETQAETFVRGTLGTEAKDVELGAAMLQLEVRRI